MTDHIRKVPIAAHRVDALLRQTPQNVVDGQETFGALLGDGLTIAGPLARTSALISTASSSRVRCRALKVARSGDSPVSNNIGAIAMTSTWYRA
jgi:hypothetical protein